MTTSSRRRPSSRRGPVRTGVTAILPRGRAGVGEPCAAGWYSLNGNGEMTGTTWIEEVRIVQSAGRAVEYARGRRLPHRRRRWVNRVHPGWPASGCCRCAPRRGTAISTTSTAATCGPNTSRQALDAATAGPVAEGSVGGGTGMNCYEFKGGNGTASRLVRYGTHDVHRRRVRAGELRRPAPN